MSFSAGRRCTSSGLTFVSFTLVLIFGSSYCTQSIPCTSKSSSVFLSKLLEIDGLTNENMTRDNIRKLISQWTVASAKRNSSCFSSSEDHTIMDCLENYCPSVDDLLHLYNISDDAKLPSDVLYQVSPALLYLSKKKECHAKLRSLPQEDEIKHRKKPSTIESWGFGFLFVTMINICSLVGAVVLPCMKKSYYKQILIFMVGLAVGSLSASGLLVLIPEALDLMYIEEQGTKDTYVWRATTVMGGVYLFFLIERFLKVIFDWKQSKSDEEETAHLYEQSHLESDGEDHTHISSIKSKTPITNSTKYREKASLTNIPMSCSNLPSSATTESQMALEASYNQSIDNSLDSFDPTASGDQKRANGHVMENKPLKGQRKIATVAWMIIFGDGLHNFIDGLSIGAAFTENTLAGISISLAVICEELPHELGDFAILLSAGMSFKKALMYNFLSACMCYFGLVVGILLGENTTAHHWIFAVAGGMFLYISLVDMMPEMNSASESEENKKHFGQRRIFLLQNVGLLIGFGVILTMVVYGGDINLE